MISRNQVMNASYNPLHLVKTYGLFGHVTRDRLEVVLAGSDDPYPGPDAAWKEYGFKVKPGDAARPPRQVAPYHLRLDWLMWFAALSPVYAGGWLLNFIAKLLAGDAATLRLLGTNPFPQRPPRYVRALLYRYRFATKPEQRQSGLWWKRELLGQYLPPMTLQDAAEPHATAAA